MYSRSYATDSSVDSRSANILTIDGFKMFGGDSVSLPSHVSRGTSTVDHDDGTMSSFDETSRASSRSHLSRRSLFSVGISSTHSDETDVVRNSVRSSRSSTSSADSIVTESEHSVQPEPHSTPIQGPIVEKGEGDLVPWSDTVGKVVRDKRRCCYMPRFLGARRFKTVLVVSTLLIIIVSLVTRPLYRSKAVESSSEQNDLPGDSDVPEVPQEEEVVPAAPTPSTLGSVGGALFPTMGNTTVPDLVSTPTPTVRLSDPPSSAPSQAFDPLLLTFNWKVTTRTFYPGKATPRPTSAYLVQETAPAATPNAYVTTPNPTLFAVVTIADEKLNAASDRPSSMPSLVPTAATSYVPTTVAEPTTFIHHMNQLYFGVSSEVELEELEEESDDFLLGGFSV